MKLESEHLYGTKTRYTLEITDHDMMFVKPDGFFRFLQKECEDSGDISDKLLFLEHMVRMIERNKKKK